MAWSPLLWLLFTRGGGKSRGLNCYVAFLIMLYWYYWYFWIYVVVPLSNNALLLTVHPHRGCLQRCSQTRALELCGVPGRRLQQLPQAVLQRHQTLRRRDHEDRRDSRPSQEIQDPFARDAPGQGGLQQTTIKYNSIKAVIAARKITNHTLVDEIESEVEKTFLGIEDSIRGVENSQKKIMDLEDYKYLLFKAREIFSNKQNKGDEQDIDFSRTTLEQLRLVNISGVLPSKDMLKFGKIIFRATKGHSILYTFSIPNDATEAFCPTI